MPYLTDPVDIRAAIATFTTANILWLDTEVADYASKTPRLSLIQVLSEATDISGDRVVVLDVLEQPELAAEFINNVMASSNIEKILHNAAYDLQFLGKRKAKKVTCTLEMVKKIPYYLVPLPNYRLKTLAEHLCQFNPLNLEEQTSDWGQRPLTPQQLHYAQMDAVYLAQVYQKLLHFLALSEPDPETENVAALTQRYRQLEVRWKQLDTEIQHLKERLKRAMESQNLAETEGFVLSFQKRNKKKVAFSKLVDCLRSADLEVEFTLELTKDLQKTLSGVLEQLPIEEESTTFSKLNIKELEDDIPF